MDETNCNWFYTTETYMKINKKNMKTQTPVWLEFWNKMHGCNFETRTDLLQCKNDDLHLSLHDQGCMFFVCNLVKTNKNMQKIKF